MCDRCLSVSFSVVASSSASGSAAGSSSTVRCISLTAVKQCAVSQQCISTGSPNPQARLRSQSPCSLSLPSHLLSPPECFCLSLCLCLGFKSGSISPSPLWASTRLKRQVPDKSIGLANGRTQVLLKLFNALFAGSSVTDGSPHI